MRCYDSAQTLGKAHGRIERRKLETTSILNEHLDWPGTQQVCRLTRTITRRGQTTRQVAYAITSVARTRADAACLLKWWRGHWGIENKVHWVRDETFGEDRSRVRSDSAPEVLASVRNLVMNWLRSRKVHAIAETLRENAWNPQPLFASLGRPND